MTSSVSAIGQAVFSQGIRPSQPAQSLTDEQKEQVSVILQDYDADQLTDDDMRAIRDAFKQAGIRPGAGLRDAITEAGFDAEVLRPPHQENGTGNDAASVPQAGAAVGGHMSLRAIMEMCDLLNIGSSDGEVLASALSKYGMSLSGVFIDISV